METYTIGNARLFDGERVLDADTVVIEGATIRAVGDRAGEFVDALGGTLLPGFIDAHSHTSVDDLRDALRFGVTTELEMTGFCTAELRAKVADLTDIADVRSALIPVSPPDGHPSIFGPLPTVDGPEAAAALIAAQVADGADYIKIMVGVLGASARASGARRTAAGQHPPRIRDDVVRG